MDKGIIDLPAADSAEEIVQRLSDLLAARDLTLFAVVDHSGAAAKVGLAMPPTRLVIFGSPMSGTPLMLAAPSTAIDLPLKILVWEDASGKRWVSYNSPEYLQERHGFPAELTQNIAGVAAIASVAAES